jgi:nucleoid DNA-binding protein
VVLLIYKEVKIVSKLNESEMIKKIHEKNPNLNKRDIKQVLDLFVEISKDSLEKGISINLKAFVTLKCEEVKGKRTYSFKAGENVELPKRILPKATFNRSFVNKIKEINNAG